MTVSADIASVDSKVDTAMVSRKKIKSISEETKQSEFIKLFRTNNMKIKSVTPSPFGLQIDFYTNYSDEIIKEVLDSYGEKEYTFKIKGNSVLIEI